jgi:uncharacterized protein with HEPN domain
MKGPERDRAALEDMRRYAASVTTHTRSGRDALTDGLTLHAVLWELAILGEAANRVSDPLRASHPEVPWRKIVNQRNILVHVYDEVDIDLLWQAVEAIPELERQVGMMLDELGES